MFENPGKKIKIFAKIFFWVESVGGSIASIVWAVAEYEAIIAFLGIAISFISAYIFSLFFVAFGELVENSNAIAGKLKNGNNILRGTVTENTNAAKAPEAVKTVPVAGKAEKTEAKTTYNYEETLYKIALSHMDTDNKVNLLSAIKDFKLLSGYKDADKLLEECEQKLNNLS